MNSLLDEVDGHTIAAQVRMERQTHRGTLLLVEGSSDVKRFAAFIDEDRCQFVVCFGKDNLLDAMYRLNEDGFLGAVGFADADFDRVEGVDPNIENVIYSDTHDFELDWLQSRSGVRFLIECSGGNVKDVAQAQAVMMELLSTLKPLACLRLLNVRHRWRLKLRELRLYNYFDGSIFQIETLIDEILKGRDRPSKSDVIRMLSVCEENENDLLQLSNGHDVCAGLGVMLQGPLGSRPISGSKPSEIEMMLRLSFDSDCLRAMPFFAAVKDWEQENRPYVVFRL